MLSIVTVYESNEDSQEQLGTFEFDTKIKIETFGTTSYPSWVYWKLLDY